MSFTKVTSTGFNVSESGRDILKAITIIGAILLAASGVGTPADAQTAMPTLTITGVASDMGSVKIRYTPVAGAQDYRVYNVSDPSDVKYAGQWHWLAGAYSSGLQINFVHNADGSLAFPLTTIDDGLNLPNGEVGSVGATEIEWNGIAPGQSQTLVVEAVNALGPAPAGNLYSSVDNSPLETCTNGMCMVGSNQGITLDGLLSTNGQGPSTNLPQVIARSQPFIVSASATPAIHSGKSNSSVFEPFGSATIQPEGIVDNNGGNEQYTLQGVKTWQVQTLAADTAHTNAFVENNHFMDVLFDGGTPYLSSVPAHNNHSVLAISPVQTAQIGNNHLMHVTMEVDAHTDDRRWVGFAITPSTDPATNFFIESGNPINTTNLGLFVQIQANNAIITQMTGLSTTAAAPFNGAQTSYTFQRPWLFGQSLTPTIGTAQGFSPLPQAGLQYSQFGRGLDNRSRFDLFFSSTRVVLYEDGSKICDQALAQPLGFPRCKVYFTHYLYHTANEINNCIQYTPYETYWINQVPYSDERHWSNMGYEVLPDTTTEWNATASLSQPSAFQAPTFALGVQLQ